MCGGLDFGPNDFEEGEEIISTCPSLSDIVRYEMGISRPEEVTIHLRDCNRCRKFLPNHCFFICVFYCESFFFNLFSYFI